MEFIIFAIIALIGGYFFVKKYSKMDVALFGSIEGYNPSGIYLVYASTVIGAVFGSLFVYKEMFDDSLNNDVMGVVIFTVMSLLLCVSIYHSILVFDSVGAMVAKSLWMIFSCALSAVIGFVGSVVVITVVFLIIFIKIITQMALGSGNTYKIKDGDGNTHTVTDGGLLFGQRDESGHEWEHTGGNEYHRKY